ncbi:MAG TPA: hypothetical protein VMD98_13980 [Bryocella sp.]|nr:hypothetical protein [Bryocella sp.]
MESRYRWVIVVPRRLHGLRGDRVDLLAARVSATDAGRNRLVTHRYIARDDAESRDDGHCRFRLGYPNVLIPALVVPGSILLRALSLRRRGRAEAAWR